MSANLVVDIANTCDYRASISMGSGINLTVGEIVDLMHANTYCNVWCAGGAGSGVIQLRIQTSDTTTSGSFTDPTSGLPQMPVNVESGGTFWVNSGLWVSGNYSVTAPVADAPQFCSGGIAFGAFQRPHQYARLISVSGPFPNWFVAGFVSNKRTTGSGGGFSWQPLAAGSVNV
ncbi:hypothetical protein C4577_07625 [Candidatus Parcubacteria bacterium]|nr:MAG: hypothetical protein C4577_07625 [Candidatus Parcubacteria bacterium]